MGSAAVDADVKGQAPDAEVVGRFDMGCQFLDGRDLGIPAGRGKPHGRDRVVEGVDGVLETGDSAPVRGLEIDPPERVAGDPCQLDD